MARDLKSLPLELLILATFDNVSGVTKYDFIGQRLITFYRAARIWPRFMKGHLFQASHVNAGRTLAYASSETIRNATTTEKAFNQTKKLVSKIPDIDNLQSSNLNSKDINKKMGQFSQYIEDFNQKALSQEKHLLEKLSQAADETSRTKISEELTNHRAAHAKAQSHFSSYTAAFDEASRLKTSGTSLSKTVAGQQTDTLLKTTAEDMDKISSQQVTKSQVRKTGEEIVEEIRYGAIKRVGMAGVVGGVVGLPHLLDATSGNSSISKIGVSVGETVGMFVPVLGTILTFTQVFRGQTLAGDKLSGWERVTTAGFGLLQLGTDVLTLFGGVGVGLRAALVGSKLGTGAAKVAHASSKAPILARVGNKIGHIIGNRVNTANKLYDKANDLNKLVDASQPLTALARTKETFKQGWRGFTEGSSHFGKNLQGFNRLGRAWTHPRAYINAPNVFHAAAFLPAAASSVLGLGYRIPRAIYRASKTALEPIMKGIRVVRRGINNKVATALTAGLGVNKAAVQAGAKAFEKFQDVNAQVVALTHRRAQIERQLLAIFKKPNGTPYTNYETLAKALNMNNRKLSKHANQDFKALRNNNLGLINEAKELTATVLKHRKDLTKLSNIANKDELKVFTHLAKNNTTSNYAKLADKLINSGSVGLKVLNAAEKTLLTTLGISIGLPLINHGTFSGTWKAAGNAATGTLDAAYESGKYAFSGERKEQRKRWYERVDEVSSNVSKLNLFKRRLLQMNINELAKLYFKGLNNRSLEAELLSVISMRGYSEQQLQNAYYATGHKTQL